VYTTFFGFQRPPFELVPDPDFLYLGESHESALANVAMGLEAGKGFVVITGPVGVGKTTILRAVLRRLAREQNVCYLSQPEMETRDLLRSILEGFDVPTYGLDVVDMRRALNELLQGSAKPGVLMIDEAHLLTEEALEQIRLLSNLEEESRKLLQIVLSGQPELKELLSRPRLRPLTQRIEMYYEISPLGAAETAAYIGRRIRIAGSPDGLVFEPRALDLIHAITGGTPRLINILADRALITAYVAETKRITEKVVQEAWADLGEVTQAVMPGAPSKGRRARVEPALPPPPPLPPRKPEPVAAAPAAAPVAAARPVRERGVGRPAPAPRVRRQRTRAARARKLPRIRIPALGLDRWLAGAGIAGVALLALMSLGSGGGAVLPAFAKGGAPERAGSTEAQPASAMETLPMSEETPAAGSPAAGTDLARMAGPQPVAPHRPLAIQVASFRELARARAFAEELRRETGEPTRVSPTEVETGLWYRVLVGECDTREDAQHMMETLRKTHDFSFLRPVQLIAASDREVSAAGDR